MFSQSLVLLVALVPAALAAQAPVFVPPALTPLSTSTNYTGATNGTLSNQTVVPGKVFDRFIQIWLENTDYNDAATSQAFMELKSQGLLLSQYYAVTHPSEPNYAAVVGGDFWGMGDDNWYNIPSNISTVIDLLEDKSISWASYMENMPDDGFQGFNFTSPNYLNASAPDYTYYVRKHNPPILYDSVVSVPERLARIRNFNDLVADVNASAIPQWLFITPNMVNDGHDTSIDFASEWLEFWLPTMLADPNFNDNRTIILLTFDENESYNINNRIYTLVLGNGLPANLKGQEDDTYYTHYSAISTVQANWGLKSLGRQDTNKTVSNVFSFVASATNYTNMNVTGDAVPLTNLTTVFNGPLNAAQYVPFTAPNMNASGAGGQGVFVAPSLNTSFTAAVAPGPVNLTALGEVVPASGPPNGTVPGAPAPTTSGSGGSGGSGSSGALALAAVPGALTLALGALVGAVLL
ncbi:phosphoesterase family-domain-containing protein [Phanerochaete sordida]|uniref:Phosphoesterase family-domain-containing protein n=1 Tax=Phanerochaete sordida TaxID=48140 RepID=A0A9P3LI85_9APHY|nr:phosphoesterase family-domain-containing protein [Phanerochaete sordida]